MYSPVTMPSIPPSQIRSATVASLIAEYSSGLLVEEPCFDKGKTPGSS